MQARVEIPRMGASSLGGGRYRLERPLGHGGMATVYLAHDEELHRPVAIKLLAENLAGDAAFRERFLREARLAARLSHPNVVSVYDAGEAEDGRPYIVMEYVPGTTFAELGHDPAGRGGRARGPGLPRPRARPRRRARAPRREAAEPAPARGRDGQGRRLRDRARRRDDRAHPGRHGARHGGLPLAGAGARRAGDRGRGRLLARRRALRAARRAGRRTSSTRSPTSRPSRPRARSCRSASSRPECRRASRTPSCARSRATPPTARPRRPTSRASSAADDEPTVPLHAPTRVAPAPADGLVALARRWRQCSILAAIVLGVALATAGRLEPAAEAAADRRAADPARDERPAAGGEDRGVAAG